MSTQQPVSSLGPEGGEDGSFRRQNSTFRDAVSADGSTDFPLEPGRYHLYAARACPWAHRTLIVRELMGLQEAVGVAETVDFDEIRAHYYRTHPMINPSGLVAMRPAASFDEPAGRS